MGLRLAPAFPWLVGWAARQGVSQMAKTFILARNATEAVAQLRRMRKEPLAFTVDILGETVVSESEADDYAKRYLNLLDALAREIKPGSPPCKSNESRRGPLPPLNVSVKISALYSQMNPADPANA